MLRLIYIQKAYFNSTLSPEADGMYVFRLTGGNICSVGLESECPGIGKIEGELFIPRENFSFSEIVVKVSCQTERSEVWQA